MATLRYVHADVFSGAPYGGNSLPVFLDGTGLSAEQMQRITQELRHFEAIFLTPAGPGSVRARIFDLFEELPFAGHPLIGAACALHAHAPGPDRRSWRFLLGDRTVTVITEADGAGYAGVLDQGVPQFLGQVAEAESFADAFSLTGEDLDPELPLEVVSTGLRYLIVPVRPGALARATVRHDLTALLALAGAQFAVLLDEAALEIRHWNNDGRVEDTATGSAAGTVGAYLLRHGRVGNGREFTLHQGRFTGRPSVMRVRANGTPAEPGTVTVGGDVAIVGHATLEVLP